MRDEGRRAEADEALRRAALDSDAIGSSALARAAKRAGDHFSGADAARETQDGHADPIEVWGRRIGRALSVVLFLVLLAGLVVQFAGR